MKAALATFSERYDLVILDGPPVMAVSDARIIARLADYTVFIVQWAKTPREVVKTAVAALLGVTNHVGIVINRVNLAKHAPLRLRRPRRLLLALPRLLRLGYRAAGRRDAAAADAGETIGVAHALSSGHGGSDERPCRLSRRPSPLDTPSTPSATSMAGPTCSRCCSAALPPRRRSIPRTPSAA